MSKRNHAKIKPRKTRPAAGLILLHIHKLKTTGGKIWIVMLPNPQTFCMEGQCLTLHQRGPPAAFLSGTTNYIIICETAGFYHGVVEVLTLLRY